MKDQPGITVVIPTRNRTGLLGETLASIRAQEYPGLLATVVVFDQSEPDESLTSDDPLRPVRVLANSRRPGIAGARNTGITAAGTELVAFCDDTDLWLPGKVAAQVAALREDPAVEFVTCGIRLFNDETGYDRPIPLTHVTQDDLLRRQLSALHPSTYLIRREALTEGFGLVSEELPGGYGEDYELLLRASRRTRIRNVPQLGVGIRMHSGSYFDFVKSSETISSALRWMLTSYPEFAGAPSGYARLAGKIAFAEAALGHTRTALRWIGRAARRRPWEPRVYLALAVTAGVSADTVVARLNRMGRGI
ncbi:glycosyltransferase family 2 protein [Rhizohabitans arisaemae]|uniref:glycosyltransferase family 2 protein n=1 Tax=Rhizohabitans arisaemae TaxID=2720610 RepID=UPI0024B0E6D4|nr:glycosyltransferase family 2 protein [Rhizohabitans arisaemae]